MIGGLSVSVCTSSYTVSGGVLIGLTLTYRSVYYCLFLEETPFYAEGMVETYSKSS